MPKHTGKGGGGKKKPKGKAAKQRKVSKVLREFKRGKLRSFTGKKVTGRGQALAIALSEAGVAFKRKKRRKKK